MGDSVHADVRGLTLGLLRTRFCLAFCCSSWGPASPSCPCAADQGPEVGPRRRLPSRGPLLRRRPGPHTQAGGRGRAGAGTLSRGPASHVC